MSNGEASPPSPVQSVDRALQILELLSARDAVGVTQIASELGVHKSTAFRLVGALEARGLVEQDGDRGKYRIGLGVVRLAGRAIASLDVVQSARPHCRLLAAETGETVNLALLSESDVFYVDQVNGPTTAQLHNWVGQRIPAHATANGRVLLSALPDDLVVEALGQQLASFTPATITSFPTLLAALEQVRRDGFAVAVDELEIGLTAVAAPVRSLHGDPVASISVSGPSFRLAQRSRSELVARVVHAAGAISSRLGWQPT